jgi:hypothetical protein
VIGYDGKGAASRLGTATLLLADESSYGNMAFDDTSQGSNVYSGSGLRKAMDEAAAALSPNERAAVVPRDLEGGAVFNDGSDKVAGDAVSGALFWPLSVRETLSLDRPVLSFSGEWWLRSPGYSVDSATIVSADGCVTASTYGVGVSGSRAVRPACLVDLSSGVVPTPTPPAKSGDATLAALSVSAGTLTPAFAPGTTRYTASVSSNVSSVVLAATAADAKAAVTGGGEKSLTEGRNTFTITVAAEDGSTLDYTVIVTRAASASGDGGGGAGGGIVNAGGGSAGSGSGSDSAGSGSGVPAPDGGPIGSSGAGAAPAPTPTIPPVTPAIPAEAETLPLPLGVKLSWSPAGNALGYNIYRSAVKGLQGERINSKPVFGGAYTDANAESGVTYYYTICEIIGQSGGQTEDRPIVEGGQTEAAVGEISGGIEGKRGFILMKIGESTMNVNGEFVEIDPGRGTAPIIANGRTLLPIRAVVETMGGHADWDEHEQKISIAALGHTLEMRIGRTDITADGRAASMDVTPEIISGRTMLPLRFVAENTGCLIEWIGSAQEVVIVYPLS